MMASRERPGTQPRWHPESIPAPSHNGVRRPPRHPATMASRERPGTQPRWRPETAPAPSHGIWRAAPQQCHLGGNARKPCPVGVQGLEGLRELPAQAWDCGTVALSEDLLGLFMRTRVSFNPQHTAHWRTKGVSGIRHSSGIRCAGAELGFQFCATAGSGSVAVLRVTLPRSLWSGEGRATGRRVGHGGVGRRQG